MASILAARCTGKGKELFFLTGNKHHAATSQTQWTFIHPRGPKEDLKRLIPLLAAQFVSLQVDIDSRKLYSPSLLEIATKAARKPPRTDLIPCSSSRVLRTSDILGSHGIAVKPFDLVDWTCVDTIPAASQPFEAERFSSGDGTYIIIDVADDLTERIAHLLAERGATLLSSIHLPTAYQRLGVQTFNDVEFVSTLSDLIAESRYRQGDYQISRDPSAYDSILAAANLVVAFNSRALNFFIALALQTYSLESCQQFELIEHLDALVGRRFAASMIALSEIINVDSMASSTAQDECFARLSEADFHVILDASVSSGRHAAQGSSRLIASLNRVKSTSGIGLPAWRQDSEFSRFIIAPIHGSMEGSKRPLQKIKQQLKGSSNLEEAVNILVQSLTNHLAVILGLAADSF
ncbi:hypothetical protein F5B21DRAFT_521981 [Xylaria acuta]|nr:hypothetical protein F5B21DRAFT_521981 [Xylaria acuta]